MMKGAAKPLLILAVCASAVAGVGAYAWLESKRPPILEVYVFDTPGTATIFIRTPADKRILMDGGSNSDIIRKITSILPFYSRRIDKVIATVADGKHVTGLVDVLDRYIVDEVVVPGLTLVDLDIASSTDSIYETFIDTANQKGIALKSAMNGDTLVLDASTSMEILFPALADDFKYSKASGPELLFRLSSGSTSIVFAGSASPKIQKYVAADLKPADVLIVSYNPSPSNMAIQLTEKSRPDYLIYSKQITSTVRIPKASVASSEKEVQDPTAGIPYNNRFNIRGTGAVKIESDGVTVRVSKLKL
ncbi:MAG: hypothetical protein KGI49_01635 [Patescibacteria group bacterium]|nr:hypothetical protein [Patescibacteria group bacterium]